MAESMELHFCGLCNFKFRSLKFCKVALSVEFSGISSKIRPLLEAPEGHPSKGHRESSNNLVKFW